MKTKLQIIMLALAILAIDSLAVYWYLDSRQTTEPVNNNAPVIPVVVPRDPATIPAKQLPPVTPFDEGAVIRNDRLLPNGERLVIADYRGQPYVMRSEDNVTWH